MKRVTAAIIVLTAFAACGEPYVIHTPPPPAANPQASPDDPQRKQTTQDPLPIVPPGAPSPNSSGGLPGHPGDGLTKPN